MKPETSATLKVIAVGCFIVFLVFLGISAPFYLRQRTILKTWPTAQAKIESGDISTVQQKHGTEYVARFLVTYRIGDSIMTSLVNSGVGARSRARAEAWLQQFPVGSNITIAYNAQQPEMVRLNPGYNRYFFAVPLFITEIGLAFAAVAVVLFIIAKRADAAIRQPSRETATRTR